MKYAAWLVLAMISVFFAETVSGSDFFPFFHAWGILILLPFYGLNLLVFLYLIGRHKALTLRTLLLGGILFGLYETFATQVVWMAEWEGTRIFDMGIVEFFILVPFWHTWMAFIIPLLVGELLLTNSRTVLATLPQKIRTLKKPVAVIVVSAIICGLMQAMNSSSYEFSTISLFTGLVVLLAIFGWRKLFENRTVTLHDLIPTKKEMFVLVPTLLLIYLFLVFVSATQNGAHTATNIIASLALYLLFAFLLRTSLKQIPNYSPTPIHQKSQYVKPVLLFLIIMTLVSALFAAFEPYATYITLSIFTIGIIVSVSLLFFTFKKPRQIDGV